MRAMTRFMVESDFRKLASSDAASLLLVLWSVMSAVGEVTRVSAVVRPDAPKPVRVTGEPVCEMSRVRAVSTGAGEENCRSEFRHISGHGRFHVHAGGTRAIQRLESCIDGSNTCDHIRTLGKRNDGGHGKGGAGVVARMKGMVKTFSEGMPNGC